MAIAGARSCAHVLDSDSCATDADCYDSFGYGATCWSGYCYPALTAPIATLCADGKCLTGNLFVEGYCARVIAECPAPGNKLDPCPGGSACVTSVLSGSGEGKTTGDYCMKTCATPPDCRQADGYVCCTTGQFQDKSWCGVGCN